MAVNFESSRLLLVLLVLATIFLSLCNAARYAPFWPPDYAENALRENWHGSYDFVIVGATIPGSVLANRLSENPKWQILVLEAGDGETHTPHKSDLVSLMENSKFTYRYDMKLNHQSCKAIKNARCYWPRDIESLYARGNHFNYNKWQWEVVNSKQWAYRKDNNKTQLHKEYVPQILNKPNLKMIKAAQVTKLVFDKSGHSVKFVEFILRGKTLKVQVNKEVIIAAGIVDTPKLLMLSGVGNTDALNQLNIPVKYNLPVGEYLEEHLAIQVFVKVKGDPTNLKNLLDIAQRLILDNQNVIYTFDNERTNEKAFYANTEVNYEIIPRNDYQNLELMLNNLKVKEELRASFKKAVKSHNLLVIFTSSRCKIPVARIQLTSTSPYRAPELYFNGTTDTENVQPKLRLINYLLKLDTQMAFQANQPDFLHIPLEECDQYQFRSVRYWLCYINYFSATVYHQVGTVRMGDYNDDMACVNPKLQLKGVDNVRVVDASIMPYAASSDTHDIEVAIAEKALYYIMYIEKSPFICKFCNFGVSRQICKH